MPLEKQLALLTFLGLLLAALLALHTVPEIVSPPAQAAVVEPRVEPEPAPVMKVKWCRPGNALQGRVDAIRARLPFYGPLPEDTDASVQRPR